MVHLTCNGEFNLIYIAGTFIGVLIGVVVFGCAKWILERIL